MKKRLIKDKILFAVEKNNYFIDRQINELAGKYKITILTSSLKIKKKFQNNFQVKFIKNKNKLEAFLEKISIFLSSPNFSKKEAYYNSLAIKQSNFLKKIYLLVKKIFWPKKNINFTSSNIFFVLFRFFYNEKNFNPDVYIPKDGNATLNVFEKLDQKLLSSVGRDTVSIDITGTTNIPVVAGDYTAVAVVSCDG